MLIYSLSIKCTYSRYLQFYNAKAKTDNATRAPAPYDNLIPFPAPDDFVEEVGVAVVLVLVPDDDFEPVVFVAVDPVVVGDAFAVAVNVTVISVAGMPEKLSVCVITAPLLWVYVHVTLG
jgi:hypothetical protein